MYCVAHNKDVRGKKTALGDFITIFIPTVQAFVMVRNNRVAESGKHIVSRPLPCDAI